MKRSRIMAFWLVAAVLMSVPVFAQDVEPPITWKGAGVASVVGDWDIEILKFDTKLKVDTDGWVSGELSTDEGTASIERLYYSYAEDGVRSLVLVAKTNEDSPMLFILSGKMLDGKLFFGDVLVKKFEKGGAIEKGLNLGNKAAQEIYPDYTPSGLKKALSKCKLVGCFKVEGKFVK